MHAAFTVDGISYEIIEDSQNVSVAAGTLTYSGDIVIPSTVTYDNCTYKVTTIGNSAFTNSTDLTSVAFPESLTKIGSYAFYGCSGLTALSLPNSLTLIDEAAFGACTGLKSVSFPESLTKMGEAAFIDCTGLTSVTLPESLTTMYRDVFYGCTGLKSVALPKSLTLINQSTFYGCTSLTSVSFPESLTNIGKYAFYGCTSLTSLALPKPLSTIDKGAFQNCTGLTSVTFPESLTQINESAFQDCTDLTLVAFPASLTTLEWYTFSGCTSLKSASFSKSTKCKYTGYHTFEGCTALTSVTFSDSQNQISPYTFKGCTGLTSVILPEALELMGNYAFSGCTGLTSVALPESLTEMGENTFEGCTGLKSVTFPASLTTIQRFDFSGCTGLTSVTLPESLATIENEAFSGCTGLKSVTFPDALTTIGNKAFYGCAGLTSIFIPSTVKSIGSAVFGSCTGLKKSAYPNTMYSPFSWGYAVSYNPAEDVIEGGLIYGPDKSSILFVPIDLEGEYTIPESVTSIGESAFLCCSGMTAVVAPVAVPTMDDNSFEGLYDKVELKVPCASAINYIESNWCQFKNITYSDAEGGVSEYANASSGLTYRLIPDLTGARNRAAVIAGDYSALTDVTIPEFIAADNTTYYVDAICNSAFKNCTGLTSVSFNALNSATSIGDYAFSNTGISEIILPATVKKIGAYAFSDTKLTSIAIPAGVTAIEEGTFSNSALQTVTLNDGLETIGREAFSMSDEKNVLSIYIPSTVKSIGQDAFYNFTAASVNISDVVKWCEIDFDSFTSNPLSNSHKLLVNEVPVSNLSIPAGVSIIKPYAFSGCTSLEGVNFNEGLQTIGDYAFFNCNLSSAVIPGSVTTIGNGAFYSYKDDTTEQETAESGFNLTLAYGSEPIEIAYDSFPSISKLTWDRPWDYSYFDTEHLTELNIGNSVKEVPSYKFSYATKLESLNFGANVASVGDYAFSNCTGLTKVTFSPALTTIGESAFADCTGINDIIFGANVTQIGANAFNGAPVKNIFITAQTPPVAADDSFSDFTGSLYVKDEETWSKYHESEYCWNKFGQYVELVEPTGMTTGNTDISGNEGDKIQLTVVLQPENVTLPELYAYSTDESVATIDKNFLVTIHDIINEEDTDKAYALKSKAADTRTCQIIVKSLYANGPEAQFTIMAGKVTGVDIIVADGDKDNGEIDWNAPMKVYDFNGIHVSDTTEGLAPGFYIVNQSKVSKKILVK